MGPTARSYQINEILIVEYRIIFFHKQGTSARTRFLYFTERNSTLGFENLPELATLLDENDCSQFLSEEWQDPQLTDTLESLEKTMQEGGLNVQLIPEFLQCIDVPNKKLLVLLAGFTDTDPPFELGERLGGEFRELPALRTINPVELQLMEKTYQCIMG